MLVITFCFSLACCAFPGRVPFSDDSKAIQVASNSVIMLSCYDKDGNLYATGSAFAAFEEGVFVTNCHVIKGEVYSIKAQLETGLEFDISSVVAYNDDRDLAILRTEANTGLKPLALGSSADLEKGEKVIAIGSPLGLINTLSTGLYSGTLKDGHTFLQFSAAISHGSSGGVLFNDKGEVVGITSASFTEGQNLNLAIPIEDAVELWESREKTEELNIPDFYDLWEHIKKYSVSYILSHKSEFSKTQTIQVDGYVFIDPYYPNTSRYYLVDTESEYYALSDALIELDECGGPLSGFAALAAKSGDLSQLTDVQLKAFAAQKKYEELIDEKAFVIIANNNSAFRGDLVLLQGDIVRMNDSLALENVVIIEKNSN